MENPGDNHELHEVPSIVSNHSSGRSGDLRDIETDMNVSLVDGQTNNLDRNHDNPRSWYQETQKVDNQSGIRSTSGSSVWKTWRTPTYAVLAGGNNDEAPKVALGNRPEVFILSFIVHLIPIIISICVIQLSFRRAFLFDVEDQSTGNVKIRQWSIRIDDFLNTLQLLAKIHEILMVSSLSAIVLYITRLHLLGRKGLPFGLLTAGYSVGSVEYIASKGFWISGMNRVFWGFTIFLACCTGYANLLGPSSAIAMIPNLGWWPDNHAYSDRAVKIGFLYNNSALWPLSLSRDNVYPLANGIEGDVCQLDFQTYRSCPIGGFEVLRTWAKAYSNVGIKQTALVVDPESDAKRLLQGDLTKNTNSTSVAISTSLTQNLAVTMSSFWQFLQTRQLPARNITRPKFIVNTEDMIYQPLVQVQCSPRSLPQYDDYLVPLFTYERSINHTEINGFSNAQDTGNKTWELPAGALGPYYLPSGKLLSNSTFLMPEGSVNLTWVDTLSNNDASPSIGAVVITPWSSTGVMENNTQFALAHACTIDARWVPSRVYYDPEVNTVVQHNLTDLTRFRNTRKSASELGISPRIAINPTWADYLNSPVVLNDTDGSTIGSFEAIMREFIIGSGPGNVSGSTNLNAYAFSPAGSLSKENSADRFIQYGYACSETVASVLAMMFTDGLARVSSAQNIIIGEQQPLGNMTAFDLQGFNHFNAFLEATGTNMTMSEWDTAPSQLVIDVQRYGYGYGLNTRTLQFGIAILVIHMLIAIGFLAYTSFRFFCRDGWISGSWGNLVDFAAMLINSEKSHALQNTCAGVDKSSTWTKRVRIREVEDKHIGIVIGDQKSQVFGQVVPGKMYGRYEIRRRRKSV
ncbi:hypothetical protein PVAG01_06930 [Phlyctema vagabunda]|uniref:Uncharacterized protein n=1 Tax=Phlyctema vagabunda TaxID=108571 RepID=A0ABR4PHJ2_9HELO